MCITPRNLPVRASVYDTVRAQTFLILHQIKTDEREMKRRRIVRIKHTPVEDNGCRLNLDSSSGICMTTVKEAQFHIKAENRRKQDKVKENVKHSNSVKRAAHIIKRGRLYDHILYAVAKILSVTKTTE